MSLSDQNRALGYRNPAGWTIYEDGEKGFILMDCGPIRVGMDYHYPTRDLAEGVLTLVRLAYGQGKADAKAEIREALGIDLSQGADQ